MLATICNAQFGPHTVLTWLDHLMLNATNKHIVTRIGVSTNTDVCPTPFGVRKIQMSLNAISN